MRAGAPALFAERRALSFGELHERSDAVARRLAARGVRPGDRVATSLGTSVETVQLIHAVQRLGAIVVPLNPRLAPSETARVLEHVAARIVVDDPAVLDDASVAPPSSLCDVLRPDDPHSVVFTSGSSGTPKGVVLTHANHAASAAGARARLALTPDDRWLLCMPLCHVGGLAIVLRSVRIGFPVVLQDGFDPERFVRAVADHRVTIVSVVATMLARVLDVVGAKRSPLASLRCVLVGGGPLPPSTLDRARAAGLPVVQTYGLTEASSMVTCQAVSGASEAGAVGPPIPGAELRIVDPDHDGVGEIAVRGPVVSPGYLGPDGTVTARPDPWLRTGDLGRLSPDGLLGIAGRRADVVVTGGENVHPTEVESVLLAHPAIAEAAVYGVADEAWGERIEAKLVFRGDPIDHATLVAWCATQLGRFKIPKAFHAVSSLPRTAAGKIRRGEL